MFNTLFLTKIVFLLAIGFFFIFTFIVYNQIRIMSNIVTETKSSNILIIIAIVNLIIAFSLFIAALVIL